MTDSPEKAAQDTRSNAAMAGPEAGSVESRLARIRIVLINTTHPGNIGATARAMKVMGLSSLHLVTPKIYPSAEATAMASGADDVLQKAVVHDSLDSALQGCALVLGTSARMRSLPMPMIDALPAKLKFSKVKACPKMPNLPSAAAPDSQVSNADQRNHSSARGATYLLMAAGPGSLSANAWPTAGTCTKLK